MTEKNYLRYELCTFITCFAVFSGNLRESSKTEVKSGTREARKTTPKQDTYLRSLAVSSQNSQSGLKYQHKGEVSGPQKTYEKGEKQKIGMKVEELPQKIQHKEEKREKMTKGKILRRT